MGKANDKNSLGISILLGIGTAIIVGVGMAAVFTKGILTQKVGEGSAGILVTVLTLISALSGNIVTGKLQSDRLLVTTAITSTALILILVLCGLSIEGRFSDVLLRVGTIVGGWLISYILCQKMSRKSVKRKRRYR